jgi:DNA-3-methyladenine glycosylase II
VSHHGAPPLWSRRPGFETLVRIILEQQVSLASGRAIYLRVKSELGTVSPLAIQRMGVSGLRHLGVTRQKAAYLVDAATRVLNTEVSMARISRASDADARAELRRVKGVGRWTADIYLLMALGRPDIWPRGDVALVTAIQALRRLDSRPTDDEANHLAEAWSPWRSVAARILWHGYLEGSLKSSGSRPVSG